MQLGFSESRQGYTPSELARGWIAKYGIRSLTNCNDDEWMLGSYFHLTKERLRHPFRPALFWLKLKWEDGIGLTWMRRDTVETTNRSFEIDHIIAKYPEVDNGARDLWYFRLYALYFSKMSYQVFESQYECISWWDLARFQTLYPDILPTMQQMQDELKNWVIEVTGDN